MPSGILGSEIANLLEFTGLERVTDPAIVVAADPKKANL
jgi:hypothetical protein